ncbi:DEAD/DEAH box helicase [bacterium]|nr:DEAD/DEAH box helicase [bacterium]
MRPSQFLELLQKDDRFARDIVHEEVLRGTRPRHMQLSPPFPSELGYALRAEGVEKLFSHQTKGITEVRNGNNVVVVTPTASGKTYVYSLSILEQCLLHPETRALLLFPLKALAQDQLKRLRTLCSQLGDKAPRIAIYDGDTPREMRAEIKDNPPNILLTNPDMLHRGMLPFHSQWSTFFRSLKYIVIDELHSYKGIFGSHVLQVFSRLRRVAKFYQSEPQFIATSATIGNPGELAESLTGVPFTVINENGAPSARRHMVFLNPTSSIYTAATRLFIESTGQGFKTIVFSRARRITELIHRWTLQSAPDLAGKISAYRAGYLSSERREIERSLQSGQLLGVISTSALEMGIDIGGLDVCILVGYPGTITATWQRAGRVGRKGRESIIFLLALPDALDQYFMRNPGDFFRRKAEAAVVDRYNPYLLRDHILCAAQEVPLRKDDMIYNFDKHQNTIAELTRDGELLEAAKGMVWFSNRKQPQRKVNIRGAGPNFAILENTSRQIVGHVNGWQAMTECHDGAVYLHHGATYIVTKLDLARQEARVKKQEVGYYTQAMSEKETEILEVFDSRENDRYKVSIGKLKVTEQVVGYEKRDNRGRDRISEHELDLPPVIYDTVGIWIEPGEPTVEALAEQKYHPMGSLHASEHATLALMPLFALCDRNDLGGISFTNHEQLKKPAVFFYDGHPGGVGLADKAFQVLDELLKDVLRLVKDCPCDEGCPSCIHSPKCGHGNIPLDKNGSIRLLEHLTGGEILKPTEEIVISEVGDKPLKTIEVSSTKNNGKARKPSVKKVVDKEATPPPMISLEELDKHDLVIFDVETQLSAKEVGGWHNAHLMRVALAVLYERQTKKYITYLEDQVFDLLERMKKADLVIGFNHISFDYSVLQTYSGEDLRSLPSLDLLAEFQTQHGYRVGLGALAQATLNVPKSADGLQSLQWWKEGKIDEIEKYCQMDVELTNRLLEYALVNGYLLHDRKNKGIVRLPLFLDIKKHLKKNTS